MPKSTAALEGQDEATPPLSPLQLSVWLIGLMLATAGFGYFDFVTGQDLSFFVFYFVPVGIAGWQLGPKSAISIAVASALTWAIADAATGHQYQHHLIPLWNALIRLISFLVVGIGSAYMRRAFRAQVEHSRSLMRALSQVKTLEGLLPICATCKKIRDDQGQWQILERYITKRIDVSFSHGVCPECARDLLREAGLPDSLLDRGGRGPT